MTVSEQVIQVLDVLCTKFGIAIDWTAANIMPQIEILCKKFIQFEIWTSVFWIGLVSVILAFCWIVYGATRKKALDIKYDLDRLYPCVNVVAGCVGAAMIIVFFGVVGTQIYDIVEANIIPEKAIFDYVSYLIKTTH